LWEVPRGRATAKGVQMRSPCGSEGADAEDLDADGYAEEVLLPDESPQGTDTGDRGDDSIRVYARVRPPSVHEGSAPCRDIVRVDAGNSIVHLLAEPPRNFAFDGVLGEASRQEEVFEIVGMGVAEACLNGYNGSLYVFGQTGSGKTHTMQGPVTALSAMHSAEQRGVMCRMMDHIFNEVARRHAGSTNVQYSCKCSYLEIYKEQIMDLLEPSSTNLQVREDVNRGVYVERLSEHSVWNVSDALHVLWKGLHQRHVGATQMNDLSSRSHAVFTLIMEAASTTAGGVTSTRVARLNLIDLAGSERQSSDQFSSGTAGAAQESLRVKEAGAINKSLSALTNVIMSLSNTGGQRRRTSSGTPASSPGPGGAASGGAGMSATSSTGQRRPFVRYRDSKLTFLLRDSLGGNSKTVIVACVSPSALCFGETLSTLKFAARAKFIRCRAVRNEEYSGTVESLRLEVKALMQQLELLSSRGLIPSGLLGRGGPRGPRLSGGSIVSDSTAAVGGDEAVESLLASGREELRRLYGSRRVRRLEILLAAAMERERKCELKRHKLDKFTQYLNGLLERKEQYFDALRDYFSHLAEQAAGEACYLPELTARLIVFRQQLWSMASENRQNAVDMLDGAIDAFLAAEGGDVASPTHSSSVPGLGTSPPRFMPQPRPGTAVPRSPSYSYGILMAEAAHRGSRRQLATASGGSCGGSIASSYPSLARLRAGGAARLSGADLPEASDAHSLSGRRSLGGPGDGLAADQDMMTLRAENRLLRRQMESHPELHRLGTENRLLREHLASLAQQAQSLDEAPLRSRKSHLSHRGNSSPSGGVGEEEASGNGEMTRERSLTRTSRSSTFLRSSQGEVRATIGEAGSAASGQAGGFGPFPGFQDATQISASSCSGGSSSSSAGAEGSDGASAEGVRGPNGSRGGGAAEAASFLPTMACRVEQLYRARKVAEDTLRHLLRSDGSKAQGGLGVDGGGPESRQEGDRGTAVEVDLQVALELFRSTREALSFAEGMLAKGKGEALLLSADGKDAGGSGFEAGGPSALFSKSASEGLDERDVFLSLMKALPRDGPLRSTAASTPQLSTLGGRLGPATAVGARLFRNQSTLQLHRIAEQPGSPSRANDRRPPGSPNVAGAAYVAQRFAGSCGMGAEGEEVTEEPSDPSSPEEMLQHASQKLRKLCRHLELIGGAYNQMKEQFRPLQEEYRRRLDECRFFEAQCRRLDVHCRLLEERATGTEGGDGAAPPQVLTSCCSVSGIQALGVRAGPSMPEGGSLWQRLAESPSRLLNVASSSGAPPPSAAFAYGQRFSPYVAAGGAPPPTQVLASGQARVPSVGLGGARRVASHAGLPLAQAAQTSGGSSAGVPAATPQQHSLLRRVVSAPQLAAFSLNSGLGGQQVAPVGHGSVGSTSGRGPRTLGSSASGTFQPSVFLSLAMQPGSKTAAMQYLDHSTNSALQSQSDLREQVRARSTLSLHQELVDHRCACSGRPVGSTSASEVAGGLPGEEHRLDLQGPGSASAGAPAPWPAAAGASLPTLPTGGSAVAGAAAFTAAIVRRPVAAASVLISQPQRQRSSGPGMQRYG